MYVWVCVCVVDIFHSFHLSMDFVKISLFLKIFFFWKNTFFFKPPH